MFQPTGIGLAAENLIVYLGYKAAVVVKVGRDPFTLIFALGACLVLCTVPESRGHRGLGHTLLALSGPSLETCGIWLATQYLLVYLCHEPAILFTLFRFFLHALLLAFSTLFEPFGVLQLLSDGGVSRSFLTFTHPFLQYVGFGFLTHNRFVKLGNKVAFFRLPFRCAGGFACFGCVGDFACFGCVGDFACFGCVRFGCVNFVCYR
jgi:hypothetical protein